MKPGTLVWLRIILYSTAAFAVAWQTTMSGVTWDSLDWVARSCLFAGILALWGNTMVAFFDKSMWRYDAEKTNGNGQPKPEADKTT
jgi:hypothetical protein